MDRKRSVKTGVVVALALLLVAVSIAPPLTCRVRAVAWVQDGDRQRAAEVKMVHLPLLGWTIESFRLGVPLL